MTMTSERFVINDDGDRVAVLIDIADYRTLLDALEEIESLRAFDRAISTPVADAVPFEDAVRQIEHDRE